MTNTNYCKLRLTFQGGYRSRTGGYLYTSV